MSIHEEGKLIFLIGILHNSFNKINNGLKNTKTHFSIFASFNNRKGPLIRKYVNNRGFIDCIGIQRKMSEIFDQMY